MFDDKQQEQAPKHNLSNSIWLIVLGFSGISYALGNPMDLGFIFLILSVILLSIDLFTREKNESETSDYADYADIPKDLHHPTDHPVI